MDVGLNLEQSCQICRQCDDGRLVFGISVPRPETTDVVNDDPENSFHIKWEDKNVISAKTPPPDNEITNTFVYDKIFHQGQRVQRICDGMLGRVENVQCLASSKFKYSGSTYIISDILLNRILPISNIFPGVKVEYKGWIGQVQHVKNEMRMALSDAENHIFRTRAAIVEVPETFQQNQISPRFSCLAPTSFEQLPLFTYPYLNGSRIPLAGQTMRFLFREMRYASWRGFTSWKRRPFLLGWHFRLKMAKCLSAEETEVQVDWTHRYLGLEEKPSPYLNKDERKLLRCQHVFPFEYIRDNSLAMLELLESDYESIYREADWDRTFFTSVSSSEPSASSTSTEDVDHVIPCKKARIELVRYPPPGTQLPVELHVLRHELTVNWEDQSSGNIWASLVQTPVRSQKIEIPPDQKYVISKPHLYPERLNTFGVNLGCSGEDVIDVIWIQAQINPFAILEENELQRIESGRLAFVRGDREKLPIFDIQFQKDFGVFNVGDIVTKSEICTDPLFDLGVIQNIGFDGKISVRVGNNSPEFRLWPAEIKRAHQETNQLLSNQIRLPNAINSAATKSVEVIIDSLNGHLNSLETCSIGNFLAAAPLTHYFIAQNSLSAMSPESLRIFRIDVIREYIGLQNFVPDGVWIRGYDDRFDLHSILLIGPPDTPFEDVIFTFDMYLPNNYPDVLPQIQYNQVSDISLSPYIQADGKVDLEALNPPLLESRVPRAKSHSTMINSFRGIINAMHEVIFKASPFVSEDTIVDSEDMNQQAMIAKQNQSVCIATLDVCLQTLSNPPEPWAAHILGYYTENLPVIAETYESWLSSNAAPFPMTPRTEGFNLAFNNRLEILNQIVEHLP